MLVEVVVVQTQTYELILLITVVVKAVHMTEIGELVPAADIVEFL